MLRVLEIFRKSKWFVLISLYIILITTIVMIVLQTVTAFPETKIYLDEDLMPQVDLVISCALLDKSSNRIQELLEEREREEIETQKNLLELAEQEKQKQEQEKKEQEKQMQRSQSNQKERGTLPSRSGGSISRTDREWLERVVMAEAGGEPYKGQVAVANVVLNRVKAHFGENIQEVIFQKGQFAPVSNGTIYKVVPSSSVKKAVSAALNGEKVVGDDVLYFINPDIATDMTIPKNKTFVVKIGHHCFYK